MIIGVPLFAIVYSVIKDIIERKLEKKGLPKDTSDYKN
jgi:predicted PurR-regulated permease PerM